MDKDDAIIDIYTTLRDKGFIWYCRQFVTDDGVGQEVSRQEIKDTNEFLQYLQTFSFEGKVDNEVEYMYGIKRIHEDKHVIFDAVYTFNKGDTRIQIGIE